MAAPKRLAFLVFPRLTLLDLVGAYDALRRVASMSIDSKVTHRIIGTDAEIADETGLTIKPDSVYEISRASTCSTCRVASAPSR